jgi:hypothetical protein
MKHIALLALILIASFAQAKEKDHSATYQVGVFSSTGQVNDGSYANCSGGGCSAYSAAHNIHFVTTNDGTYAIESPVSVAGSLLLGMMSSGGVAPTVHKAWFMDQLHEGDKMLFAVKCNNRNRCEFWLPNPDRVGKEVNTIGSFEPTVAKTNATFLCGTGKLSAAVEAQVCSQPAALAPVPASSFVPPPKEEIADPQIARLKVMCETGMVTNPAMNCGLYGFNYPGKTK